jgi:hypothetical protein
MNEEANPKYVDDTDFGLSNNLANKTLLRKLETKKSKKKVAVLTLADGMKLPIMSTGADEDNGYYWIAKDDAIVWLVKFRRMHYTWLPKPALTQVMLWRDNNVVLKAGFTSRMFFGFILKRHGAILSDKEQTEAGERFWKLRLEEAFEKKLKIAFVNFNDQSVTEVTSAAHLQSFYAKAWGPNKVHLSYRWMIWKE